MGRFGLASSAGKENEFISHYRQSAAAKRIYAKHGKTLDRYGLGLDIRGTANYLRNPFGEGLFSLNDRLAAWYPRYPTVGVLERVSAGETAGNWTAAEDSEPKDKAAAFYAEALWELRRDWEKHHR